MMLGLSGLYTSATGRPINSSALTNVTLSRKQLAGMSGRNDGAQDLVTKKMAIALMAGLKVLQKADGIKMLALELLLVDLKN
jgi:hypothetical protein